MDYKNLNTNKKRLSNGKFKLIILMGAFIATNLAGCSINEPSEEEQREMIVNYYGEDSIENDILRYMDLKDELQDLNLDEYQVDENLFKEYNISNELMSPKEIESLILKKKTSNKDISDKEITKQAETINVILNLVKQQSLINEYLYETGHDIVYDNITEATKRYAGEVFDIENYNDIELLKSEGSAPTDTSFKVNYKENYNNRTYYFDNSLKSDDEEKIAEGIDMMISVSPKYNDKISDEDMIDALALSAEINNIVDVEDLKDEDMIKKMR